MISSGSLNYSKKFIQFENEGNLPGSNTDRYITPIPVSHKDDHLFLAEYSNHSITELKELGEFVN